VNGAAKEKKKSFPNAPFGTLARRLFEVTSSDAWKLIFPTLRRSLFIFPGQRAFALLAGRRAERA
jgi:hypothetical protein